MRFQKRSDTGRCFYISRPNNPTKDTWPKLELKWLSSSEQMRMRVSESPACKFNLSLLPHCEPRRESLCPDRYQCASLLWNLPCIQQQQQQAHWRKMCQLSQSLLIANVQKLLLSKVQRPSFSWNGSLCPLTDINVPLCADKQTSQIKRSQRMCDPPLSHLCDHSTNRVAKCQFFYTDHFCPTKFTPIKIT